MKGLNTVFGLTLVLVLGTTACGAQSTKNTIDEPAVEDAPVAVEPINLHSQFALSQQEFVDLIESTRGIDRDQALARPQQLLDRAAVILNQDEALWILVDKQNPLPAQWAPQALVNLDNYAGELVLNKPNLYLSTLAFPGLQNLVKAARSEGIELPISSTYRSYETQERTFNYWVGIDGREKALTYSAEPGKSQHQLGTTVDFGSITDAFANTQAGRWLEAHGLEHGWSMSYPPSGQAFTGYVWESWHFRYVGTEVGSFIADYFSGIQQFSLQFLDELRQYGIQDS